MQKIYTVALSAGLDPGFSPSRLPEAFPEAGCACSSGRVPPVGVRAERALGARAASDGGLRLIVTGKCKIRE
jgi:hypothetical protein